MSASKFIKCVTVGDGAVGKTCMLICYTSNKFPTASFLKNQSISKRERPFLFVLLFLHLFSILSLLHACQYCLWVFFVISLLGFSTPILGHLLGQKVSVLTNNKSFGWQRILCHNALTDHDYIPTVFDNFSTNVAVDGMGALSTRDYGTLQWMPELRRFAPNVPIVLIGTKLDLREDRGYLADHMGSNIITTAQGEDLRKQIGAAAYIECSSKTQQNVKAVFDTAIKVVLQPPRRKEVARKKRQRSTGCSIVGMVCGGCVLDA